jgi:hypothetical protein
VDGSREEEYEGGNPGKEKRGEGIGEGREEDKWKCPRMARQ